LGLPAPMSDGSENPTNPFIAIPTNLLFSKKIELKKDQKELSID